VKSPIIDLPAQAPTFVSRDVVDQLAQGVAIAAMGLTDSEGKKLMLRPGALHVATYARPVIVAMLAAGGTIEERDGP
jgi:hypothetical protein